LKQGKELFWLLPVWLVDRVTCCISFGVIFLQGYKSLTVPVKMLIDLF